MKSSTVFGFWAPAILIGAVCLCPVHASGQAQAGAAATQGLLDTAHALEVRGRLDLATQKWQQVLLTDPNNTEALGGLARAAKAGGNNALAAQYIERLRQINPNDPGIARAEQMGAAQSNNVQLQQAGKLAQQGQYAQAMNVYRGLYGGTPPPGDIALGYYETEAATEEGRPHAIAGLRQLSEKFPGDARYQIALGRILTYNPKTREEGRRLLEAHPNDPGAVEALRQSLLWDSRNPATAGEIRAYLAHHSDQQLSTALRSLPTTRAAAPLTPAQRAAAAVNATRTAEDQAAYRELNEKKLVEAEQSFKAILAKAPDDPNALAGMGYIRMQQQNFGGAISFLSRAKQDGSKDPGLEGALGTSRFFYTLGEGAIALNGGDVPAAERDYKAALVLRPDSPEALEGLGGSYLKAGQPQSAIPYFLEFVRVHPEAPHAWRGLFLAEYGARDTTRALATERQIPASVRAQLNGDPLFLRTLASAYSAAGRDGDAQRVLKAALDLPFPADAKGVEVDTELQYAALLEQANHLEQAAGLYRQVLAKDQNNTAAWEGLVRAEHALSEDQQAVQTIESMPQASYAQAMREPGFEQTVASIYQGQGRLDVAQDILEKAIAQQTTTGQKPSVAVQIQLAGIYLQRGNGQQAYPLYQQVLSEHPDNTDAWKGLLSSLHTAGRDQEVLAEVRQIPAPVRTQLENDPSYLQTIGGVYDSLGQPQEAQVFLRRVQQHYAAQHAVAPADIDIQNAYLLYNAMNDRGLYLQLMSLGDRTDLTDAQRRTVQEIWTNWAVRRAGQAAKAGDDKKAIAILNATAEAFPGNPAVLKALAGGYAQAGMPKRAVEIWKAENLKSASAADYRAAVGSALADNDQKDAETWLRFGLNQYPKDAELLVLAAKFEEARGDNSRAAEFYKASLKALPPEDPGAELASELSRPAPATQLPNNGNAHGLAGLLQPDAGSNVALPPPAPPYLPSFNSTGAGAPVPMSGPADGSGYGNGYGNGSGQPGPASAPVTPLRDYAPPHAELQGPAIFGLRGGRRVPVRGSGGLDDARGGLILTAAVIQQYVVVRAERQASPVLVAELEMPRFASWQQTGQSVGALGQSQQTGRSGQTNTGSAAAPAAGQGTASGSSVYGAYVPYVPPQNAAKTGGAAQTATPQLTAQPVGVQQTTATGRITPAVQLTPTTQQTATGQQTSSGQTSAGQAAATGQQATPAKTPATETYGPYVPYVAPAVPVKLGNTTPVRATVQPEVTDVLPKAKYVPNANGTTSSTSSHPEITAADAAAARRRQSHPARTGQSEPPVEDYSTAPTQPASYTGQQGGGQVTQPGSSSLPAMGTTGQQQGDSNGQQYPQPGTRYNGSEESTVAPRGRARASRARASAATRPAAPTAAVSTPPPAPVYQGLSYPGVGQSLGYQPYPTIGPAFPLGTAPSDDDLEQRRLPPLRGPYYTGEELAPQVPLTERQQTQLELETLEGAYSGWLGGTGSARYRSGTPGVDRLTDLEATFEASATVGDNVRFTVVPKAVFLNSGALAAGSSNTNPVLGSLAGDFITAPQQQVASGVGGEFQVSTKNFAAAIGYTPYEFLVQNYTGRILYKPDQHFTFYGDRSPVVETQLSYAGLRDPGQATLFTSGPIWGGVVSTGGGLRYDMGTARAGFYITADGADLSGYHVLENNKFEASAGAYFLAHTFPGYGRLNVGVSMFGQHYQYNELGLTYGLGGYFSPQAYFLASVPVTFVGRYGNNFHYSIAGAVGVQTFQESSEVFFPLDRGLENGSMDGCTLQQQTTGNCGQTPVNSTTGGNFSINTEGAYRITDHWYAGGFLSANNTNNYNTVTGGFFVRYVFRPQYGNEDYPTGLFPVEGFRPLRVP